MDIKKLYKPGYEIHRATVMNDGGIEKKTWTKINTIPGRLSPLTAEEIIANEKMQYTATDKFYCDVVDVREEDRIVDTNRNNTYEIKKIINPFDKDEFLKLHLEFVR